MWKTVIEVDGWSLIISCDRALVCNLLDVDSTSCKFRCLGFESLIDADLFFSIIRDHTFKYCSVTDQPATETRGRDRSIFSDTILEVTKNTKAPINVLHITSMSAFRSDAHVGKWSENPSVPDCSHWCLPGVPDVWNEILLSYLLSEYNLPSKWPKHIQVSAYLSNPQR